MVNDDTQELEVVKKKTHFKLFVLLAAIVVVLVVAGVATGMLLGQGNGRISAGGEQTTLLNEQALVPEGCTKIDTTTGSVDSQAGGNFIVTVEKGGSDATSVTVTTQTKDMEAGQDGGSFAIISGPSAGDPTLQAVEAWSCPSSSTTVDMTN